MQGSDYRVAANWEWVSCVWLSCTASSCYFHMAEWRLLSVKYRKNNRKNNGFRCDRLDIRWKKFNHDYEKNILLQFRTWTMYSSQSLYTPHQASQGVKSTAGYSPADTGSAAVPNNALCIFSYKYLSETVKSNWSVKCMQGMGESARWADLTIRLIVKANSMCARIFRCGLFLHLTTVEWRLSRSTAKHHRLIKIPDFS